jgi:MoxR-like ATPase
MSIPGGITREHIVAAALRLDAGEPHGFGQANTWNVVIDGRHYAPKQVIGVAARIGLGLELAPGDFSGGEAPGGTNRYLRDLGFEIVPIPEAAEMSHENLDTAGVVASPRVRDILRVLTRLPVARGQVGFLKMLREAGESGVAAAEIQAKLFKKHPNQAAGLLAAFAKKINSTELESGPKLGLGLVMRDVSGRKVAMPELWEAIRLLPPLAQEIERPWTEVMEETRYVMCAMPPGISPARQARGEDDAAAPFDQFRQRVRRKLVYSDETLSAFLLALQTKRFVILSGISGTGKTQLALAMAGSSGPMPSEVEEAQGERFTVEVQPYMLKYQRMVLPSALLDRAHLPVSSANWASTPVQLRWPEGSQSVSLGSDAARPNNRQLFLKGPVKSWFHESFKPGDRLLIDAVPSSDGEWDEIVFDKVESRRRAAVRNCEVIPVRPDWRDVRGLLGFYNPVTEKYQRTVFLDLVLDAEREVKRALDEAREPTPFFAVLDEMNLAHVEQYFADFLSAMESGEPIPLHRNESVHAGGATGDPIPMRLVVPPNLYVIGTVNVDETTHMFSPKVLDRAFVMELNEVWLEEEPPKSALLLTRFPDALPVWRKPEKEDWDALPLTAGEEARDLLLALQRTLRHEGRPLGYRPLFEMARFLQLAFEQAEDTPDARRAALDQAVLQKVLPKLVGSQQELEPVLRRLFDVAVDGGESVDAEPRHAPNAWRVSPAGRLDSVAKDSPGVVVLPRCGAKLHRMLRDVARHGFASFIG